MSDALWGFLGIIVTGIFAYAGIIRQTRKSNDELYNKLDKQSALSDAKIQGEIDNIRTEMAGLKTEVAKHNGLIERTYRLERDVAVLDQKQKVADNRIADLENHKAG